MSDFVIIKGNGVVFTWRGLRSEIPEPMRTAVALIDTVHTYDSILFPSKYAYATLAGVGHKVISISGHERDRYNLCARWVSVGCGDD